MAEEAFPQVTVNLQSVFAYKCCSNTNFHFARFNIYKRVIFIMYNFHKMSINLVDKPYIISSCNKMGAVSGK